ncbi:1-(5-phosphoribosyl)-5-[(5-phosphoribosylamino)methylideneamino]imidazole-4-carboxamide isomerase [Saccharicrinis fermentans]|uniref:1-(5-phosphoribosyl)-5-[(5-phosphoribosylamino)methylideneamino] imidazole-4-carboxamide isomerase n=1 Tax=Saccharicrinis fermentans DSM 9555 = JCM 21142 TaxID=869213 RepID=W7Y9R2_9BACT|nr:1-(5-phosphoribosyl)-5-[(5-phosphoribosylamino)methylideneamino]imidazole-4-carboxamide isomerase [Saccharicrinis fermentans]GAF04253.1 1-(5-phosphoribosyl)-5-[(5-phosphoribosylamino)methylideneamino] imidazole-4-carboxamide isomerase [Saccharicrinis fermentans DSM 9555 = JCM 21142]
MALIDIIPAIDIIDGKCVRLSQGDYAQKKVYNEHPLEVAQMFQDHGIKRLHLVDLDGAKASRIINYKVLETIASKTNLIIDFGGGLKSDEDLRIAFESGAQMITGGSIAVKNKEVFTGWIEKYGPEKIILGADVKNEMIAVSGWTETSDSALMPFIETYINKGISKVICTDIGKDGMLTGTATELYEKILVAFPDLYLVASGGLSSLKDIDDLVEAKVPAVITGKAIYEGKIELKQLEKYA